MVLQFETEMSPLAHDLNDWASAPGTFLKSVEVSGDGSW